MARFGDLDTQYLDDAGNPLISGKIAFKDSGTNNDKDTFADIDETPGLVNPNPLILNADGTQPNCFFSGTAKAILYDQNDVQIRVLDPAGAAAAMDIFPAWDSTSTYSFGNYVAGSDDLVYKCIVTSSQGNDPTSVATDWSQYKFTGVWNTNESYAVGDIVQASNNSLYVALVAQSGNNPISDKVSWRPLSSQVYSATETYIIGDVVSDSTGLLWRSLVNANIGNTPSTSPTQWASAVNGSLSFISSATASSDATIDFTGIDSTYDDYEIHLLNVIPVDDVANIWIRTSTDGGATFDSGASDYAYTFMYTAGVSVAAITSTGAAQMVFSNDTGSAANELGVSGVIRIIRPSEATYTNILFSGGHVDSTARPGPINAYGSRLSAADVDAVQFLFDTGSIESGLFALYGVKRA